jgi:DNA polymerase III subunit epsilon
MYDFVAFDVETTGIEPTSHHIIEIAAVRFAGGRSVGSFSSLVRPPCRIPQEATRINGINDEMVAAAPTIADIMPRFRDFCRDSVLVAHNAPFDEGHVSAAVLSHNCPAPTGLILDTLEMARRVRPGLRSYRLGKLVESFGIPMTHFHRAEADAGYCGEIFTKLVEAAAGDGPLPNLKQLTRLSGGDRYFAQALPPPQQLDLAVFSHK